MTAALLSLLASDAFAEPDEGAYAHHHGVTVGIGAGVSSAKRACADCSVEIAGGFDFFIGGFLRPRLALVYDVSAWLDRVEGFTVALGANTVAAQYWLRPDVWIKAGVGLAQYRVGAFESAVFGIAGTGAAGLELAETENFAYDVSTRVNVMQIEDAGALTVALNLGARWK